MAGDGTTRGSDRTTTDDQPKGGFCTEGKGRAPITHAPSRSTIALLQFSFISHRADPSRQGLTEEEVATSYRLDDREGLLGGEDVLRGPEDVQVAAQALGGRSEAWA